MALISSNITLYSNPNSARLKLIARRIETIKLTAIIQNGAE